jgi:hypothetical protein
MDAMKVRSLATGEIIDLADDAANELIEAGIYEPVEANEPPPVLTKMARPITGRRPRP